MKSRLATKGYMIRDISLARVPTADQVKSWFEIVIFAPRELLRQTGRHPTANVKGVGLMSPGLYCYGDKVLRCSSNRSMASYKVS